MAERIHLRRQTQFGWRKLVRNVVAQRTHGRCSRWASNTTAAFDGKLLMCAISRATVHPTAVVLDLLPKPPQANASAVGSSGAGS